MLAATIRDRLVLLITLFGVAVSVLNMAFLWGLTKWVEDFIFESLLKEEYARMQAVGVFHGEQGKIETGPFHAFSSIDDIPQQWKPWLSGLAEGIHELEGEHSLMAIVSRQADGGTHYLVLKTDELEYVESNSAMVLGYAALVLLLTMVGAVLISLYLVQRIIGPLNRFTRQITHLDPARPPQPIAPGFGNDEIGAMARAFDSLQERLADFVNRERRFTADVSHELRTPLAVSSNAIELLNEAGLGSAEFRIIDRLNRSIRRMESLVETFLALAREENACAEMHGLASLGHLVDSALEFHSYAYPHYRATVLRDYDPELQLHGSTTLLEILFRNLLVNAVLHSPDNTVRVIAGGNTVIIRNSMQKDHKGGGAGIGLSIAERIAEALGYTLRTNQAGGTFEAVLGIQPSIQSSSNSRPGRAWAGDVPPPGEIRIQPACQPKPEDNLKD